MKTVVTDDTSFSAIADTFPMRTFIAKKGSFDYNQTTEALTRKVNEFCHS